MANPEMLRIYQLSARLGGGFSWNGDRAADRHEAWACELAVRTCPGFYSMAWKKMMSWGQSCL